MNEDMIKHVENEKSKLIRRLWPGHLRLLNSADKLAINVKQVIKSNAASRIIFVSNDPGKIYRLGLELVESGVGNRSIQFDDLSIVRVDGPAGRNQWIAADFLPQERTKSIVLCPTQCNNKLVLETFINSWFNKGTKVIGVCTAFELGASYHNVINLDVSDLRL